MTCGYPYLISGMIGFLVVLTAFAFWAQSRRFMLLGGLALLPFSLCAVLHEQSYWNAVRLGGLAWGIEDILFTFSVGSLIAGIGSHVFRCPTAEPMNWPVFFRRYVLLGGVGTAIAWFLNASGMDIMQATIVTQILMITGLGFISRSRIFHGLIAALIYSTYYAMMTLVFFALCPQFKTCWNGSHLWPAEIGGIHLEEIVWVFTFAWSWILILMHCLEIRKNEQGEIHESA